MRRKKDSSAVKWRGNDEVAEDLRRFTRRIFLVGAGSGMATAIGCSAKGEGRSVPEETIRYDKSFDLIVVGAGAAGLTAAVTAALDGKKVAVLEAMPLPGGTTAISGGVFWIPNNPIQREQGRVDDKETALRYMARVAYPHQYNPSKTQLGLDDNAFEKIETYYDEGSQMVEHLVKNQVLMVEQLDHKPDYSAHLPENGGIYGRPLYAKPDREGDRPSGATLIGRLLTSFKSKGGEVFLEHRVVGLVTDAGKVTGVKVELGDGSESLMEAKNGVIFGSGGFSKDPEMCRSFLPGYTLGGCGGLGSRGDFIRMTRGLKVPLGNMSGGWWQQVNALKKRSPRTPRTTPCFTPRGDSMIMVNFEGKRVLNEHAVYDSRTRAHFDWNTTYTAPKSVLLFMIYDQEAVDNLRLPTSETSESALSAPSLSALKDEISKSLTTLVDEVGPFELHSNFEETLNATIERFNEFAKAGTDLDFERGEREIERWWFRANTIGIPEGPVGKAFDEEQPNLTMYPINKQSKRFHAVILAPGLMDTKGGPVTNRYAQLINDEGNSIEGLYGAGNCVSAVSGTGYWGSGGTIGPAMVFGYVAAKHATKGNA